MRMPRSLIVRSLTDGRRPRISLLSGNIRTSPEADGSSVVP
ncbi:hypothetical protein PABG_11595 [Paracoccidioides brasiliensis Pb03]|nr:hypothetical protein PABG_11595 [Paracoccidioides brasiliensis Pb03]